MGALISHENGGNSSLSSKDVCLLKHLPLVTRVQVTIPFSYRLSKNQLYGRNRYGGCFINRTAKQIKDELIFKFKTHLHETKFVENKTWVGLYVYKPNSRGDAINTIDLLCDAVEAAIGINDRWFSMGGVDWEISRDDPRIIVTAGQISTVNCQICSTCCISKPQATSFSRNSRVKRGFQNECKACQKEKRASKRAKKA